MNMSTQGRVSLITLAAVILLLPGCSSLTPANTDNTSTPRADAADPATDASPTPAESAAIDAVDLGCGAEEEQVTGDWLVGWYLPFTEDDERFHWEGGEEPSGAYRYRDTENDCMITMEVARLDDEAMSEDDRLISDTMLVANVTGGTAAEDVEAMRTGATEDRIWQEGKAATVDFRVWHVSSPAKGSAFVAARGFGAMAAGLIMAVICPAGPVNAVSEYQEIVDEHARISARWPSDDSATPRADATDPVVGARPSPSSRCAPDRIAPCDLSFETGADLDPAAWRVQWFTFGNGYSELEPDDGNGHRANTDNASQCSIDLYQGTVFDLDWSQDDRTISDEMLWVMASGIMPGATREDVTANAFDDSVPLFIDEGTVPFRTVWGGAEDGSTWLDSARMFGSLGNGLNIFIKCPPGQDASLVYERLRDDHSMVVDVSPGSS